MTAYLLPPSDDAEEQSLLNATARWHRTVIRVHQDRRGRVLRVELIERSGRAVIDEAALAAARAMRPGRPPSRVIGDRDEISSDWAIEIGDVSASPLVIGCTDDGACSFLGHGVVRVRVELLDVNDAMFSDDEGD